MEGTESKRRFLYPTPGWLVILSLAVTGILFLSERFQWFPFNTHKGWTVLIAAASVGVVLALMLLWLIIALVFRLRFQFSIRSLLVLVIAVALPFSWLGVTMRKAREQKQAVDLLRKNGGQVWHAASCQNLGSLVPGANTNIYPSAQAQDCRFVRNLLGDDFFNDVVEVSMGFPSVADTITDTDLQCLRGLPQLRILLLGNCPHVTNAGMENLKGLVQLESLTIYGIGVTNAGLENLEGLLHLKRLMLIDSKADGYGLKHLKGLSQLGELILGGFDIAIPGRPEHDAQLECIKGLTQLQRLAIDSTNVTPDDVEMLQRALPDCEIKKF